MAKQVELNKQKGKGTSQGENRPVWNNVQRLNHQNKFVPKAVLTKTGIFSVNTARPIMNEIRLRNNFYKSHSPIRRPFNKSIAPKAKFTNNKVNTAGGKIVSVVRGYRETAVKASAGKRDQERIRNAKNSTTKGKLLRGRTHVTTENKANKTAGPKEANHSAGTQDNIDAGNSEMEAEPAQEYFVLPLWSSYTLTVKSSKAKNGDEKPNGDIGPKTNVEPKDQEDQAFLEELKRLKRQENEANDAAEAFRKDTSISAASPLNVFSAGGPDLNNNDQDDSQIPALEDIYDNPSDGIFSNASYEDEGAVADFTNLDIHHFVYIEPKKISQALKDKSWVDAMQEELLNKKDKRGVVVRNKARLVTQGYRQEEEIDYDEVFAPVAKIEAIRIFLAFASYMGFIVYQMDVKSVFLYGTIDEKVYVSQPPCFVDPKFPRKFYKVVKALYGLHQAPIAWYATLFTFLLKSGYRRGTIDKTLFIKKDKNDIMLVQVYVDDIIFEILKKFDFASVKTVRTPIETQKPLTKDKEAADVDVHLYRSMIGSSMYLTASRPDIMFAVCACSRFQVTPKTSHLHAMKRIFRYLKGIPKLGLWYPKVSSFDLEAYSDSAYAEANLNRKSTPGVCQFLGSRLISWQYKKQTIVATSTIEAEYVASANCCGQVLWIQNQMLDYGFNFMNTKIYIDNESTICIVKNLVFHSKTKHIEIRHHFIRDAYKKKLIHVLKIHTDDNVANLLTKAFNVNTGRPKLNAGRPKLSTVRPKLSTDSTKIERMKLEAIVKEIRIFTCWLYNPTTNGHQFTMSNGHQELASPEQTALCKDFSNPLMADSLPKTIWFSSHHALQKRVG
ncbi:putative ribonuclease H-like domain-containing protein [Tanacetum coccineum]